MTEQFLSLNNINKRYAGVQALQSVDFDIDKGEIHCLVGENGSGKSTLIKIISGVVQPDEGAIITIDGEQLQDYQAIDAIHKGIEVIYQDLSLFPNLTVAENIALGEIIAAGHKFIQWKEIEQIATHAMGKIKANLPLDELVENISLADQQLVAICRALTHEVRLVIMDEPTTALTRKEVDALFSVVQDLQSKGISVMFVSHKLDEVFEIAESITILRDGAKVGTFPCKELDNEKMVMLMTGKKLEYARFKGELQSGTALFEVRGLSKSGNFKDVNLKLYPGEILGITGLLGSGRTEFAQAIFGLNPAASGEILLEGKPTELNNVQDAIGLGIAYVPENRLVQGLVMQQSVGKNLVITILKNLLNSAGLISQDKMKGSIDECIKSLTIKVPSADSPVQTLSGGNQQRVVLAKWIATQPKILILDGPTVGVDVAAKGAIHDIVRGLAAQGVGIIIISDELSEVYHNCTRVFVMHKGRFVGEFQTEKTSEDEIKDFIAQSR
ncbi:MAG: sugar ABC transporter ATP-binding protein [Anaerolineales bacterium]|nr:sugar ABC transporter ATP-binding protein [Anaerolineales bacterium]